MRVKSPIGEYDYRVTAVRLKREGIEVEGSLGQWQTTMVVEPKDVARIAKALGAFAAAALLLRLRR